MARRVIDLLAVGGRWHSVYSCYIDGCNNKEYKFRMCEKHLKLLEESFPI